MIAVVSASAIQGSVTAPASKSMMQRYCAAALLHNGTTVINNPGNAADDLAALRCIGHLGATITRLSAEKLSISSNGIIVPAQHELHVGESGLSARLFTPIAAIAAQSLTVTGAGSLMQRPMDLWMDILPGLNVRLDNFTGFMPLHIKGPMQAKDIVLDGAVSSQYLSGLLFAFCKIAKHPVTISVNKLSSKPYIDVTLEVLNYFGYQLENDGYSRFMIMPGCVAPAEISVTVEGDWSNAAALVVAGVLIGDIAIKGLNAQSAQGDKRVVGILQQAGADISWSMQELICRKSSIQSFDADLTDTPDLFPVLAVAAMLAKGVSRLNGVSRLTYKESNRTESILAMLHAFGVKAYADADVMVIEGRDSPSGAIVASFNDHRIVMAAAVAGLKAGGRTEILQAEAIKKSYPDFFNHLESLGAHCTFTEV